MISGFYCHIWLILIICVRTMYIKPTVCKEIYVLLCCCCVEILGLFWFIYSHITLFVYFLCCYYTFYSVFCVLWIRIIDLPITLRRPIGDVSSSIVGNVTILCGKKTNLIFYDNSLQISPCGANIQSLRRTTFSTYLYIQKQMFLMFLIRILTRIYNTQNINKSVNMLFFTIKNKQIHYHCWFNTHNIFKNERFKGF